MNYRSNWTGFKLLLGIVILVSVATITGMIGYLIGRNPLLNPSDNTTDSNKKSLSGKSSRENSIYSNLHLKNVRFRWTKTRYIETKELQLRAIPLGGREVFDLDKPNSFILYLLKGEVDVGFATMEEIFNDSVFHYKGTNLKDIKLETISIQGENGIRLSGKMQLGVWLNFQLDCLAKVKDNKIHLTPINVEALGIPFVKGALDLVGLPLDVLLPIQPGRGAELEGNTVVIDPFLLFHSPGITGKLSSVRIGEKKISVGFDTQKQLSLPLPPLKAPKNTIFLWGGNVKFGRLTMENAKIQMVDRNQDNIFDFFLEYYMRSIVAGKANLTGSGEVIVTMPDFF